MSGNNGKKLEGSPSGSRGTPFNYDPRVSQPPSGPRPIPIRSSHNTYTHEDEYTNQIRSYGRQLPGSPFPNSLGSHGVPAEPIRLEHAPDPLSRGPPNNAPYYVPHDDDSRFETRTPYYGPSTASYDTNPNFQFGREQPRFNSSTEANTSPLSGSPSTSFSEWRRPTITPQNYRDEMAHERGLYPSSLPSEPSARYLFVRDDTAGILDLRQSRHNQARLSQEAAQRRDHRGGFSPYSLTERRNTIRPSGSPYGPIESSQHVERHSNYSRYSSSAIHLPPPPLTVTHTGSPSPEIHPHSPLNHPFSRSLPSSSHFPHWSDEYVQSPATTPAPTEGSADPAQSDQEDFGVHTSTSPSTSTSTSISPTRISTASRWARFRIPPDIFINPPDPVRHQLYHQIRQEPWFNQQQNERQLTSAESNRIPGSIPGESVLLAFYDRVIEGGNRAMMRCTICAQTNPSAQLYQRPDRAKVHMRHHFELRPISCNGQCNTQQCSQRFFTHSDLTAHVNGKTEPLASCPFCGKMMRQKNMKRHTNHFCPKRPDKDLPSDYSY